MSTPNMSTHTTPSNGAVGRAVESASGAVHRAMESVSDATRPTFEHAASGARHAVESVSSAAKHVAASVEAGGQQLKHAGKRFNGGLRTQLHDRPYTSVAIAVGAGFLLSWLMRPR